MTRAPERLLAGQVGKPHGLAGEVYVVLISDDPRRFEPGAQLLHEDGRTLVVESARPHRTRFLVRFAGITGREQAEQLRGALYISTDDARELEGDEFWEHDVVGATVMALDGSKLGEVVGLEHGPGQDRLVVATPRGERYVPLVVEIVRDISRDRHLVTIDPPEGLLD